MNFAMISNWHVHAKGYAKEINSIPGCKVTAVWNEDAKSGKEWAEELNCNFYESYDELLQDKSIDGVLINAPTNTHPEIIIKAAQAGKHIFTEKVLAITLEEAMQIKEAVEKSGVKFTISFPHRCRADILFAKNLAESGGLGTLTYARIRNAHNGSVADWLPAHFYDKTQCGGGAQIDLGAHGMYLLKWFLGMPKQVVSVFTNVTDRPVEDNAVSVLAFENGAIGVAETGFVSTSNPFTLELSGTEGTLLVRENVRYANKSTEGKWVTAETLPEPLPNPIASWVDSIQNNTEALFNMDEAVALTEIMEAAYKAHKNQGFVAL